PAGRRRLPGQGSFPARDAAPGARAGAPQPGASEGVGRRGTGPGSRRAAGRPGELTVTLHHNINNPLMSASADLELLLAEPDMPVARRQQTLRDIQAAMHRIRDLVRQIGDLRDVRTKAYLPGLRMVDLEAAGPAALV